MRKVLILTAIIVLAISVTAVGSWQFVRLVKGATGIGASTTAEPENLEGTDTDSSDASVEDSGADAAGVEEGGQASGAGTDLSDIEASEAEDPNMRLVTETQRHQNFLKALAEGKIKRMDVASTNFKPSGDSDTSYLSVIVATTDGNRSDGTIVMKYLDGLWRFGAVKLKGSLAGGTNLDVPASFEEDLARELSENQEFFTKMAEGRLAYLSSSSANQVSAAEVVLTGEVGSKGGQTWPVQMTLRQDYGLWHITNIRGLY